MNDARFSTGRLLALYDRISDAPDAIARLRHFVFDLAAGGKLTDYGPQKEQVHLLGDVADFVMGQAPPGSTCNGDGKGTLFVKVGEFGERYPEHKAWTTKPLRFAEKGDVLICVVGATVGKLNLGIRCAIGRSVAAIRPKPELDSQYLYYALMPFTMKLREGARGSAQGVISRKDLSAISIWVPPHTEQHRIVDKVDELMALCDRLEEQRTGRETLRGRLTTASLARLTAPESDGDAFKPHARFALANLAALTARPDQIKGLRRTILSLAVCGRLIKQDPSDEPASALLKRVREWNRLAVAQKTIRTPRKLLAPISSDECPYVLPRNWAFARLGEIIYIRSGDGLTSANMNGGTIPVFGGNGVNGYHDQANVHQPTIVIGRVGYYCGSVHVTPTDAWVTDNAFITHFSQDEIYLRFLALLLKATNLKEEESATAQPVISGSKIYPIVVGLPPLAEQRRIVAKVDALMSLCDRLESSLTAAYTTRRRLLESLLHEALAPVAGTREAAE